MDWTIPGTVLRCRQQEAEHIETLFCPMFLAGGISLSQVCGITGLEPHTVQNWVKRGFLPPPQRKRYSLNQLCRLLLIHMLGGVVPMERICSLLSYVNGRLDDQTDDIIDDAALYFMFVRLAARLRELTDNDARERALQAVLSEYEEPQPGAAERVQTAMRILLTAYLAARMLQQAEIMLAEL